MLYYYAREIEEEDDVNVEGSVEEKKDNTPIEEFTADKWVFNVLTGENDAAFTGKPGPQHTLSPDSAVPYEYFCLFIPVYFWSRWAQYTNSKAEIERGKSNKKGRPWTPTCAAELKAWVASIMFWSFFKTFSFQNFYMYNMDPQKIKQWFPDLRRWQQLKRFFKVSDPNTDGEHLDDKAWRVRDLWDYFISACKANYWPHCEVSLDEAIKNSKVTALLSSISKINLSAGALKFLLCAVPTLRTCGMQIFTLEKNQRMKQTLRPKRSNQ